MAHTDDDTVLAQAIFNIINTNKVALAITTVLYGNHNMIPTNACAVVIAAGKRRQLEGVSGPGGRTSNQLMVRILMHWSKVGIEDTERKAVDTRATVLERKLNEDTTVGGIIIHGFVTDTDRGETQIADGGMFRSVEMTYVGVTKTYLSPPAAPS